MGIFPQLLLYIPLPPLFFFQLTPPPPFTVLPIQYLLPPHTLTNIHAPVIIGWLDIWESTASAIQSFARF